jgi:hypothetical protein
MEERPELSGFLRLAGSIGLAVFCAFPPTETAAQGLNEAAYDRCRAIPEDAARLRCFESIMFDRPAAPGTPAAPSLGARSTSIGRWRLVRTPHPQGGKEAVSVMRSAEFSGSDPEFAGLVLRCGERDVEVLLAVIGQMSFRARPHVTMKTSNSSGEYEASIAPPGLLVLLPHEVTDLALGAWRSASDLSVSIADEQHTIRGSVQLADIKAASDLLVASCPQQ